MFALAQPLSGRLRTCIAFSYTCVQTPDVSLIIITIIIDLIIIIIIPVRITTTIPIHTFAPAILMFITIASSLIIMLVVLIV